MLDRVTFDPVKHEYFLDGRLLPNITRIIDWMNSYAGVPSDVMNQARDLGDIVHLTTELYDRDDLVIESVHSMIEPYLAAWQQFRYDTGFIPELIEHRVLSLKHWFAGRLDRVGRFKNSDRGLVEIKTTAKSMPANGPQTAAQKQGLIEQGYPGAESLKRYSLRLCPELSPPYRLTQHSDPQDLNVFLCSLQISNWRKNNGYRE